MNLAALKPFYLRTWLEQDAGLAMGQLWGTVARGQVGRAQPAGERGRLGAAIAPRGCCGIGGG